jgi:signal transduction histidine kinase
MLHSRNKLSTEPPATGLLRQKSLRTPEFHLNYTPVTLEAIPLFRSLGRAELQTLRTIAQERRFTLGQVIFREGDAGDGVYFVKSGLVEISAGGGRVFSRLGDGEIFGEMSIIEHRPRSATATAAQATEVYFLPRGEMLVFIEHSPAVAFGLLQKISHRLRELNQLHLREIVQAERLAAIGDFARSIIHDLKNPLSIIGLSAQNFSKPNLSDEARQETQARIRRQVQRINDLVGDILTFTEQCNNADIRPGDLCSFMAELVAELKSELAEKSIQLVLENVPPAPPIPFDARRLGRVFHNLIYNAKDFLEPGGSIFLRFKVSDQELHVEIEDTGPGIAPEIADKLFQPFATHGKSHGTGLGLSICKKIIEDHGGKISARSEPGRGAIFLFTLPLAK